MCMSQKEMIQALKIEWKRLWQERQDDKVRAEGIAVTDYCDLFVERGTVIHATRSFKSLSFRDILEQHKIENVDRLVSPDPRIGGWNKFIKTNITNQHARRRRRADFYFEAKKKKQQIKKGGRGWLHL